MNRPFAARFKLRGCLLNILNILEESRQMMSTFGMYLFLEEIKWTCLKDHGLRVSTIPFQNKLSHRRRTRKGIRKKKLSIDPEAIYAQALGLLLSDRNFPFGDIIAYELRDFPPAYFKEDGEMRLATTKSSLKRP